MIVLIVIGLLLFMIGYRIYGAFLDRQFIYHHDSPGFPPCDIYNTPWLMTATPPRVTRATPQVGEQNDYVFRDIMGLEPAQIEQFKADGILN